MLIFRQPGGSPLTWDAEEPETRLALVAGRDEEFGLRGDEAQGRMGVADFQPSSCRGMRGMPLRILSASRPFESLETARLCFIS